MDSNTYALKIELDLSLDKIGSSIDELSDKMEQVERSVSESAQNALNTINENVTEIISALDQFKNKIDAEINPSVETLNTHFEKSTTHLKGMEESFDKLEDAFKDIGTHIEKSVDGLKQMETAFSSLQTGSVAILGQFAQMSQVLEASFKSIAKMSEDLSKTMSDIHTKAEDISRATRGIDDNLESARSTTGDLDGLFDGIKDTTNDIWRGWSEIRSWLESATKGIEEFRTANYRLNGSMYELLATAKSIDATIGDFGQSIQIIKALNAIKVPRKEMQAYGQAIAEANVYTGLGIDVLAEQVAVMRSVGMSASESSDFLKQYADVMNETGATTEDLNAILSDQELALSKLSFIYGGTSKEALKMAQSFQVVAIEYAAMAKSMGVSSRAVVSDMSNAVKPLTQTNMILSGMLGRQVRTADDLSMAMGRLSKQLINVSELNKLDPASRTMYLAQIAAVSGLSEETIILEAKIAELAAAQGKDITNLEHRNELMRQARAETDPFGAATADLNAELTKLARVFQPVIYALSAAAEILANIIRVINQAIDGVISLTTQFYNFTKGIADALGLGEEFTAVLNGISGFFKIAVGTVTLFALGLVFLGGVLTSVGTLALGFMKILGEGFEGLGKRIINVGRQAFQAIGTGIQSTLTSIGNGLRSLGMAVTGMGKNLLIAGAALLLVATSMLILAYAIKIIAAEGMNAVAAAIALAIAFGAIAAALIFLIPVAAAAVPVLIPLGLAILMIVGAVALLAFGIAAIIAAFSMVIDSVTSFVKMLIDSLDRLILLLPQFGFAFAQLGLQVMLGAGFLLLGGAMLVPAVALLALGAAGLSAVSIVFAAANMAFGWATAGFKDRAEEFHAGAKYISDGANNIVKASDALIDASIRLAGLEDAATKIMNLANSLVQVTTALSRSSFALLGSAIIYQISAVMISGAFNMIASALESFAVAAVRIVESAAVFDQAMVILDKAVSKLASLTIKFMAGIAGLYASVYGLIGVSGYFMIGASLLAVAGYIFYGGVSLIYTSSVMLLASGSMIAIASDLVSVATDKLKSISANLSDITRPLFSVASALSGAAIKLGIAALVFLPTARALGASSGYIESFARSINSLSSIETTNLTRAANDISYSLGELSKISADSFAVAAQNLDEGISHLEGPVDRLISLLSKLKDSLSQLKQEVSLEQSLGQLANDVNKYANVVDSSAAKIESTMAARVVPALDIAEQQGVKEAIKNSPLSSVTINTKTDETASEEDEAAAINRQMLDTMKNILGAVEAKGDDAAVRAILALLGQFLPELRSSGGNLSSEFNSWS